MEIGDAIVWKNNLQLCGKSSCKKHQNPYPGCFCGALDRFFPQNYGLPRCVNRSALHVNPFNSFRRGSPFEAAVFVKAFRPPCLLATQTVPTLYSISNIGRCGFYIQAERGLLPPHALEMLATRIGQLVAGDLHSIRLPALTAAPTHTALHATVHII